MSKAQRRREEKEAGKEARRHGEEPRFVCPFPGCGRPFWTDEGKPNACNDHKKLIGDVIFILDHLKTREGGPGVEEETGPILYVPKPGTSKQAIEEALKKSKGGKKPWRPTFTRNQDSE